MEKGQFTCVRCSKSLGKHTFEEVIKHNIAEHADKSLVVGESLGLSEKSGNFEIKTIEYGVIPQFMTNNGEDCIDNENCTVRVTPENVKSTQNMEDFEESNHDLNKDDHIRDIRNLIDAVESAEDVIMSDKYLLESLITFFKNLGTGTFPSDNISLLLFLDTVDFFACKDSRFNEDS